MQPLRQPCVEVEGQGGVGQRGEVGFVQGYSVVLQAGEVVK